MDELDQDDLQEVRRLRDMTAPITERALDDARRRLLAEATARPGQSWRRAPARFGWRERPRRRTAAPTGRWVPPRTGWWVAGVAAVVALAVLGVTIARGDGVDRPTAVPATPATAAPTRPPPRPPANAAELLERAASVIALGHGADPRPDQWIYQKQRLTTAADAGGVATGGPYETRTFETWRRADGRAIAGTGGGRVVVHDQPGNAWPPQDAATIGSLPTDPGRLLAWIYRKLATTPGLSGGTAEDRYESAYSAINVLLRDNVLSPQLQAAMYRALARIPGVTLVRGTVDADGRPAVALNRVQEGWLYEQVLLDRRTYAYLGERAVAVRGHRVRGDDLTADIRAGTLQRLLVRVEAAIVDRPGDRPRPPRPRPTRPE